MELLNNGVIKGCGLHRVTSSEGPYQND